MSSLLSDFLAWTFPLRGSAWIPDLSLKSVLLRFTFDAGTTRSRRLNPFGSVGLPGSEFFCNYLIHHPKIHRLLRFRNPLPSLLPSWQLLPLPDFCLNAPFISRIIIFLGVPHFSLQSFHLSLPVSFFLPVFQPVTEVPELPDRQEYPSYRTPP